MMQYLLAVHGNEDEAPPAPEVMQEDLAGPFDAFNKELQVASAWVFAGGLFPASTATVVRIRDGEVVTTDGPFTETKEQIGGFWIIKARDLDAAIAWAAKGSEACQAPVEVRPFQDWPRAPGPAPRRRSACGRRRRATPGSRPDPGADLDDQEGGGEGQRDEQTPSGQVAQIDQMGMGVVMRVIVTPMLVTMVIVTVGVLGLGSHVRLLYPHRVCRK